MSGRTRWLIAGACAVVVLGAAVFVFWPRAMPVPDAAVSSTPVATTAPPLAQQVQEQLDDHLTACAESDDAAPPAHCGISIPWGTEFTTVTGIRYRIEQMPRLTIDGETFTAADGVIVATVTGTAPDGSARTETYRSTDWAVRGDLRIDGGSVTITVW